MIINEDLLLFFLPDEKEPKNPVHPIANAQAGARLPDVPLPPHRSNQIFCLLINKKQKTGLKLNFQQVRIYIQSGFRHAWPAAAGALPLEWALKMK